MPTADLGELKLLMNEFRQLRSEQLALCQELEDVADMLGGKPDKQFCIHVAEEIGPLMKRALDFEKNELFPLLLKTAASDKVVANSIDRLKREHHEDADLAPEVSETLLDFGRGTTRLSEDAIGYLLRGFFASLRRHLAFESEVLNSALGA